MFQDYPQTSLFTHTGSLQRWKYCHKYLRPTNGVGRYAPMMTNIKPPCPVTHPSYCGLTSLSFHYQLNNLPLPATAQNGNILARLDVLFFPEESLWMLTAAHTGLSAMSALLLQVVLLASTISSTPFLRTCKIRYPFRLIGRPWAPQPLSIVAGGMLRCPFCGGTRISTRSVSAVLRLASASPITSHLSENSTYKTRATPPKPFAEFYHSCSCRI